MAYALGDTLVRVQMEADSGLVEDRIVNDFAFTKASPADVNDYTDMAGWIEDFYNTGNGILEPVASYLGSQIDRGSTHLLQFYNIVAGPLGAPAYELAWIGPSAPTGTDNLPTEVAGVASFHATLVGQDEEVGATRPRARRRGRLYLGPLTTQAVQSLSVPSPLLGTEFRTAMAFAMAELRDASTALSIPWGVWSRADLVVRPVVGGWTDNAFDTQRRRGTAATARAVWGNP